jgi:hypothetical protein
MAYLNSKNGRKNRLRPLGVKVEGPMTDKGPISDVIFKSPTFLRHVSMHAMDTSLELKLPGIGSSI